MRKIYDRILEHLSLPREVFENEIKHILEFEEPPEEEEVHSGEEGK